MEYLNSALEDWLRKNKMPTNKFCELVGCSRNTIWKLKRNLAISPQIAAKICSVTNGEVMPRSSPRGRRW